LCQECTESEVAKFKKTAKPVEEESVKVRDIALKPNQWNLLTMVVDGSTKHATLWVNGEAVYMGDLPNAGQDGPPSPFAIDPSPTHGGLLLFGFGDLISNGGEKTLRLGPLCGGGKARVVRVDTRALARPEVWEYHVPRGVWMCRKQSCRVRNSPDARKCIMCKHIRERSGSRPEGDVWEDHPGLAKIVRDSFDELVMDAGMLVSRHSLLWHGGPHHPHSPVKMNTLRPLSNID
jgi:hypothetical protein